MSVTHPAGFAAAGVSAGLKASGGKDVAVIVNQGPSNVVAAVWTSNRCLANPVLWTNVEKTVPRHFITADGFGITGACRRYLEPLIGGEDYP
ncbi:MAG TPA: hypothetical protein VLK34_01880, partial [Nocardioidaceae bacterium]|nr:hypothetical protein [Nocardioidaceae bacterium]